MDISDVANKNTPMKTEKPKVENASIGVAALKTVREVSRMESQGTDVPVSEEQLIKAIERAVKAIQGPYTYMEFSVHETTKLISVKVHDRDTGEIIREIPPEKTLDFVAKLWEMAGIFIDEKR
jgi:flagellar protein FlaG